MTVEKINITLDDKKISVTKGVNIIEAAKEAGTEIPYYCYHPYLSVPGNCRMCQVEVAGAPKLMVGCHTKVAEGMEVRTHLTSSKVKEAQASTLELILINHPLDCTVCDQSGHCKLQDYHFEYNARPSRFIENKVNKIKAEPLGPTVILDGERCIMCTRCIRFCDEITKTSELGMLNRGDRSVIAVNPGKELNNPLSGTVVDLCPVGALTHRNWRFNSRIWYTKDTDTICPGCSTGCNCKVYVRDGEVLQVKARVNDAVNKEWMCDEGRYGFERFLPKNRVTENYYKTEKISFENAIKEFIQILKSQPTIFLTPNLLVEDYILLKDLLQAGNFTARVVLAYKERKLTETEAILISPDYAANFQGAVYAGLAADDLENNYTNALNLLSAGQINSAIFLGDWSIDPSDQNEQLLSAIQNCQLTAGVLSNNASALSQAVQLLIPGKSILEKSGFLLNRSKILQYAELSLDAPQNTKAEWEVLVAAAKTLNINWPSFDSDRELNNWFLQSRPEFKDLTIKAVKAGGIAL